MPIILIATMRTEPDRRDEALETVRGFVPRVHAERGCELYAPHTSGKDGIVIVEQWADRESLDAHGSGETLAELNAAMAPYTVADMTVTSLRPAPAGDSAKGAIRPEMVKEGTR